MTPLRLRVDVCTYRGLRDGVPRVLETLRRFRARATFFVAFGPDSSGRALVKLLNPAFAWKMFRTGAVGSYGLATAFYGTLLPSPLVGAGLPDRVRRILDDGHEIGMHGWDHRRWQDALPSFERRRLADEFGRMVGAFREATGRDPACAAAPAWLATPALLEEEEAAGLAWAADVRGRAPFLPVVDGREFRVPQMPVTLPTLDELVGRTGRKGLASAIARQAAGQEDYCCYAAHAETEGGMYRPEFEELLGSLERGVSPVGEAPRAGLPRSAMTAGRVDGRPYDVCIQATG